MYLSLFNKIVNEEKHMMPVIKKCPATTIAIISFSFEKYMTLEIETLNAYAAIKFRNTIAKHLRVMAHSKIIL
jgi:hypothetical protein